MFATNGGQRERIQKNSSRFSEATRRSGRITPGGCGAVGAATNQCGRSLQEVV